VSNVKQVGDSIMTFSIEQWQARAKQKYETLTQWLSRQTTPVGYMAYGALTTFTMWPLVEVISAAAQAGQPLPYEAFMALGGVAGGVGGNLLASQIQNWYEAASRGEAPDEADVLAWLSEHALAKEELQPALDQILEALQAVRQAHETVAPADWGPFFQQLLADMQQIGNFANYEAQLIGDGLIVQGDHNIVADRGGVIVQGNLGELVMGNKIIEQTDPSQIDEQALREAYLGTVMDEYNRLLLGGIDPKVVTAEKERLRLSAIYTALLTESTKKERLQDTIPDREDPQKQPRRLSALEQLNKYRHLVILGHPGSGKSTFVNFVAVCLAGENLEDETLNLDLLTTPLPEEDGSRSRSRDKEKIAEPQPWDHGALLPVCITLREFAARGLPPAGHEGTANHLWDFLTVELHAGGLGQFAPLLQKEMLERGGLFLFDGLDEVPASDQHRVQIKQVVQDIARTCRRSHILVTSRTYAYQEQQWRLPDFADTVLAPFSKGQIERFVDRWYEQMAALGRFSAQDATGRATLLKGTILNSPRLFEFSERPLLLTLMASLHAWRGGSLPQKREELYADAVDLLLDMWEQQRLMRATDGSLQLLQPSLEQWLKVDRDKVRGLLEKLAFEGHQKQPDTVGTADILGDDLVLGLIKLSDDASLQPAQLVNYLSNRSGLLLPKGQDIYTFPHRTFQEYLAACHLTGPSYPDQIAQLARKEPNRWREVALLAGAKAARGSAFALWGLVQELCYQDPGQGDDTDYWGAHLAGQFLLETAVLTDLTTAQQRHMDRVRHWLVEVLTDPVLPVSERAATGRHLAQLGDPRPEVTSADGMQFCYVPGGDFWMGEGDEASRVAFLNDPYWIGRFPVAHAQYMDFVEDGGYGRAEWWEEAIGAGLWEDGAYTWPERRTAPYDWGSQFRMANLPVVGVSWFEALAYTRWLAARWHSKGWLPHNWQVTLPSEAEWEKAARGGLHIPLDPIVRSLADAAAMANLAIPQQDNPDPRRDYTWLQEDLTTELANYNATEINQTSSAGCYRDAVSVYGCEEMLGNVWEWTRSLRKGYPYDPHDGREILRRAGSDWTTLRGGSWRSGESYQRCSARLRHSPVDGNAALGFGWCCPHF
jgi:formylglycine-generating enzyme required for sulfatase activity/energy-coupling factor transporter ATP-binding protein EcfA2